MSKAFNYFAVAVLTVNACVGVALLHISVVAPTTTTSSVR